MNYTNKQMIYDLWHYVLPYKTRFFIGSFLRITNDLGRLVLPWIFGRIITVAAGFVPGINEREIIYLAIAAAAIAIYSHAMRDVSKYFIYPIAEKASLDARRRVTEHLFALNLSWHQTENTGNKQKRLHTGVESINKIIRVYVDLMVESTLNVIVVSIVMTTIQWQLTAILLFFFVTYYLLSLKLSRRAADQSHVVNTVWEVFDGATFEAINNISTVKSLNLGKRILKTLDKISSKLIKEIKLRVKYFRIREGGLNIYQEIFRLIITFATVWFVIKGITPVGTIAMVILYFGKIESSAWEFSEVYNEFIHAKIGIMRMQEVLNEKPHIEQAGRTLFNKNWNTITLKNVTFSYGHRNVLDNISLSIKRGEKIGIVGISGAGKSTLFKLLLQLHGIYKGEILFNDTDLREIKRSSYIPQVAVVPQETELFNMTLKDNITIGETPSSVHTSLKEVMAIAHITDFLPKLPDGADTLIGEKGFKLSGGERQRVGIARALYRHPQLLLLDEATSHLDTASEQKIREALQKFFKNITAIVIAHRLSTIQLMDRIIVMQNGGIAEEGSFDELIERKGVFFDLWTTQKF